MSKPPSQLNKNIHAALLDIVSSEPTSDQLNQALRLLAKWRAKLIENSVMQKSGTRIKHGPFAGMNYNITASEGGRVPRMLGAYETTLAPIIDEIVACGPKLIIDVGCAEGYYAVGLARRLPSATIWARDANPAAQTKCRELAETNGVADRVEVGGVMTHWDFDICLLHDTVIICDIEGAEKDLLDPIRAKGLLGADILVECHPSADPNMVGLLRDRFASSHKIIQLERDLDVSALPQWMDGYSDLDRLLALWEWRATPTPWLWMTAKPATQ